jgi:hypothetical protein
MPIDHFTREQFEAALPQSTLHGQVLWCHTGLDNGEHTYVVSVAKPGWVIWIVIRSSVHANDQSANVGEDSIRMWLADGHGPLASKLTKYVTRVKGWDKRMTTQLRTLYKIGLALKPCPQCGDLMHAFIAGKGKESQALEQNKGRVFQKCVRVNAAGLGLYGCVGSFEWIEFKEDQKRAS